MSLILRLTGPMGLAQTLCTDVPLLGEKTMICPNQRSTAERPSGDRRFETQRLDTKEVPSHPLDPGAAA